MLAVGNCKKTYTSFAARNSFLLTLNTFLLKYAPCIYYPLRFKKDQTKVQALLDSSNKVNAMTSDYMASLDLKIRPINIKAQKINNSILSIFDIALISFRVNNKLSQS